MSPNRIAAAVLLLVALTTSTADAQMRITEWMYNGATEFIEFTNMGFGSIDMTDWSFDDADRVPGSVDLSAFGIVGPGESVILTEVLEADFRTSWGLAASVRVIGGNDNNLGRGDEINLYDALDALVDRLTYGDNVAPYVGSIRTNAISGNPMTPAALGVNDVFQWVLSAPGDAFGSYTSLDGDVGNPGMYVPEPTSIVLIMFGVAGLVLSRRRG